MTEIQNSTPSEDEKTDDVLQETTEEKKLEPIASEEPDTYHKPETLFRIAIWSGWISWAFLVVALLNFGLRIYNNYYPMVASGQVDAQTIMYILVNEAYTLLFMAFIFLVLQGVSQVSYILMDLFESHNK